MSRSGMNSLFHTSFGESDDVGGFESRAAHTLKHCMCASGRPMNSGGILVRVIENYELGLLAMILLLSFCWLFELFLVIAILVFLTGSIPDPEKSTVSGILAASILA